MRYLVIIILLLTQGCTTTDTAVRAMAAGADAYCLRSPEGRLFFRQQVARAIAPHSMEMHCHSIDLVSPTEKAQ